MSPWVSMWKGSRLEKAMLSLTEEVLWGAATTTPEACCKAEDCSAAASAGARDPCGVIGSISFAGPWSRCCSSSSRSPSCEFGGDAGTTCTRWKDQQDQPRTSTLGSFRKPSPTRSSWRIRRWNPQSKDLGCSWHFRSRRPLWSCWQKTRRSGLRSRSWRLLWTEARQHLQTCRFMELARKQQLHDEPFAAQMMMLLLMMMMMMMLDQASIDRGRGPWKPSLLWNLGCVSGMSIPSHPGRGERIQPAAGCEMGRGRYHTSKARRSTSARGAMSASTAKTPRTATQRVAARPNQRGKLTPSRSQSHSWETCGGMISSPDDAVAAPARGNVPMVPGAAASAIRIPAFLNSLPRWLLNFLRPPTFFWAPSWRCPDAPVALRQSPAALGRWHCPTLRLSELEGTWIPGRM